MVITEVYGNAPPDAFICAIAEHIAEKMKEDAEHEHLGAAGGSARVAGKEVPMPRA